VRVFFFSRSPFSVPFLDDSNDPIQSGDWESPAGPPLFCGEGGDECRGNITSVPLAIVSYSFFLFFYICIRVWHYTVYHQQKQVLQTQPPTAHTLCRVHMINYPYFMMHSHGLAFYHKNIQHFRPFFFFLKYPVSFLFYNSDCWCRVWEAETEHESWPAVLWR
jgi:hypothetical protein